MTELVRVLLSRYCVCCFYFGVLSCKEQSICVRGSERESEFARRAHERENERESERKRERKGERARGRERERERETEKERGRETERERERVKESEMKMEREHEHETKSAHKQHKVCTNKIARQHERALGRALVTNHSKSARGSEQKGVRENACNRETMERLLKIIGLFCKRTL